MNNVDKRPDELSTNHKTKPETLKHGISIASDGGMKISIINTGTVISTCIILLLFYYYFITDESQTRKR